MKKIYALISLAILFTFNGIAQTTLILQPDSADGKTAKITSCVPCGWDDANDYGTDELGANAWTYGGDISNERGLVQFDLSTIPANAIITSATLSLYWNPNPKSGNVGQSTLSGSNAGWLQRITSNWDQHTVTWDSQPPTTTQSEIIVPESISDSESYPDIDVKLLVQDMINNPSQSFGFMLRLQDETDYRSLIFCSCNYSDSTKHPKLEITYATVAPPVASFQSGDSSICATGCTNFTDHSANATSWFWFFPGASPVLSTVENPQNICYNAAGDYDVMLIASNSSGSDTLYMTKYITVNASPPTPGIRVSGDTLFCSTDTGYASYQWFYAVTAIPGATDTFLVAAYNGNYNVKVANKNGCSIAVGINVALGLDEVESNSYFSMYPNPVISELNISMPKTVPKAEMEITDITGRKLFQGIFDSSENRDQFIDFNNFASGVYFISVSFSNTRIIRKIIKE